MKLVKDKKIVVGADSAGYPLKEAVVEHLHYLQEHDVMLLQNHEVWLMTLRNKWVP